METFSTLLALCVGNSPVPSEFPAQRTVTRSFHVFFDLRLNKSLSKQSWSWWFETLSRYDVTVTITIIAVDYYLIFNWHCLVNPLLHVYNTNIGGCEFMVISFRCVFGIISEQLSKLYSHFSTLRIQMASHDPLVMKWLYTRKFDISFLKTTNGTDVTQIVGYCNMVYLVNLVIKTAWTTSKDGNNYLTFKEF